MPSYRSEEFDPITALFEDAEALHNLSSLLSEDRAGFACLLVLLADDVKRCAEALEAEEKKIPIWRHKGRDIPTGTLVSIQRESGIKMK